MPVIEEIKTIDGELWVRIPKHVLKASGVVGIYTDDEIEGIKKKERRLMAHIMNELVENPDNVVIKP